MQFWHVLLVERDRLSPAFLPGAVDVNVISTSASTFG
jgi:hypothetical protein